ncbi:hypothetical protein [Pontibacter pamirensis]|uniref:hypothetical protein n=1 Tax=Pontibacter pamirensis TaxID=2562824 RepID=UPI001389AE93|nr:hypothetical protein [Pontibacter pamirensis]
MGDIIQAICPCGLESEAIFQGIGFNYYETGYAVEPAYCDTCGIVTGKDISKNFSKCPECRRKMKFYRDEMEATKEEQELLPSYIDYQEAKRYWHCPRCKRQTLRFESTGCWD